MIDFLRYKGLDSTPPGTNNEVVGTPKQEGVSPKKVKQVVLGGTPSDSNQTDTQVSPHKNVPLLEDDNVLSNKEDWVKKKEAQVKNTSHHYQE